MILQRPITSLQLQLKRVINAAKPKASVNESGTKLVKAAHWLAPVNIVLLYGSSTV
jgi:hypothetical protein